MMIENKGKSMATTRMREQHDDITSAGAGLIEAAKRSPAYRGNLPETGKSGTGILKGIEDHKLAAASTGTLGVGGALMGYAQQLPQVLSPVTLPSGQSMGSVALQAGSGFGFTGDGTAYSLTHAIANPVAIYNFGFSQYLINGQAAFGIVSQTDPTNGTPAQIIATKTVELSVGSVTQVAPGLMVKFTESVASQVGTPDKVYVQFFNAVPNSMQHVLTFISADVLVIGALGLGTALVLGLRHRHNAKEASHLEEASIANS